jgi:aminopeptidase C
MNVPINAPVNLHAIDVSLRKDGQVEEVCWPYGGVKVDLVSTVYFGSALGQPIDEHTLLSRLESGQAVGLALSIDQAFYDVGADVLTGSQWTSEVAKHAVLAVGCRPTGTQAEILVRNSWGEDWGVGGHCWCEFSYLAQSAMFMFSVSAKI